MASFNFDNCAFNNNNLDFDFDFNFNFNFDNSGYNTASSSTLPSTPRDDTREAFTDLLPQLTWDESIPLETALGGLPTNDAGQYMPSSTYDPSQQDLLYRIFPQESAAVDAAQNFSWPGCTFPDNSTQFLPTADMSAYGTTAYAQPYMQTQAEVPQFPSLDQTAPLVPTQTYFPQQLPGPQTDNAVPPPPPPSQPVAQGPPATTQSQQQGANNDDEEKEHRCDHCDKSFCDPSGLAKHKKTVRHRGPGPRSGKRYVCRFCRNTGRTAVFARSDQLKRHLKNNCRNCTRGANGLPAGYRDGVGGMDAGMEMA